MRQKVFFKNLDALRFIAFLFIFLGHALDTESNAILNSDVYAWVKNYVYIFGKTGFSFAFVLSSYINTWVILEERQNAGHFKPWLYYVRRAIRIWPLYFLVLFIGFVVLPFVLELMNQPYHEVGNPWYFILFVGNFFLIEHGWTHSPIISVLWSVSVEEQFYIFWPFLLILFRKNEKWLFAILLLVFGITTFHYYGTDVNLWFHTLFLLGDIAIGALFAFISFNKNWGYKTLEAFGKKTIIGIYGLFLFSFLFYHHLFDNPLLPGFVNLIIEKLFYAFILSYFIFEQNFGLHSFFKFGKLKTITYLGVISYGLFCFHEIGLLIGNQVLIRTGTDSNIWAFLMLKPLIAFAIITPMAHLSWNYFEKPLLGMKRHFYTK
ncbi:MAG: acyltransferase [Flavobacteriales bacterium]|nr:acyltransferase [Flavobacteriales bacterium]MCB9203371.1 acyltransferase [Flavobacteriales bacterium]